MLVFLLEFYRRERVAFVCFPILSAEQVLGGSRCPHLPGMASVGASVSCRVLGSELAGTCSGLSGWPSLVLSAVQEL